MGIRVLATYLLRLVVLSQTSFNPRHSIPRSEPIISSN